MNYFKCINEVKPSYVIDTEPQFNETILYENQTSANEDITLSDNYNNYDIIKFYCYDTDSNYTQYTQYYATPAMLNHMVTYFDGYCNFNIPPTNQYTLYRVTSNTTLTYRAARNMYPIRITGLKCGNGSIVETKIYGKQAIDSVWASIETEYNLFDDFNLLLGISGHGWDELCISPQVYICANDKELNMVNDNDTQLIEWNVPYYYHNAYVKVSEHSISDNYWIYVAGLKFVPNWDYYIDNIEFSGASGQQIPTGIFPFKDGNINRNWQISFKFTEETVSGNSGLVNMVSNFDGSNSNINVWRQGQDYRIVGTQMPSHWSNKAVDIKYTYNGGISNSIQVYYDGELVSTFALNYSNAQHYLTKELSVGFTVVNYTNYYANGHLDYFGFRWLS